MSNFVCYCLVQKIERLKIAKEHVKRTVQEQKLTTEDESFAKTARIKYVAFYICFCCTSYKNIVCCLPFASSERD